MFAVRDPVLRIGPGAIVQTRTFSRPGDYSERTGGDAFRIAPIELIEWLVEDYGFERMDGYQIVSQAGHSRVANVVDPIYTVVAKFPTECSRRECRVPEVRA